MMRLLLFERLDWVNLVKISFENYRDDGPIGCFLNVDFDYPDELNDMHNDYPLATKKK